MKFKTAKRYILLRLIGADSTIVVGFFKCECGKPRAIIAPSWSKHVTKKEIKSIIKDIINLQAEYIQGEKKAQKQETTTYIS